jgi:DNA-binding transcriptional regulator of glucitol operon
MNSLCVVVVVVVAAATAAVAELPMSRYQQYNTYFSIKAKSSIF